MLKASEIHNKIVDIIRYRGPSLPIQIAKEMSMSSLFMSAFLSELAKEKRVKVSNLRVGGSPLYYLIGQEEKLENFQKYMHPKESEAFVLLKENKVLIDSEQDPAIRVALRSIKDFAIPFRNNDEVFWRYHLTTEAQIVELFKPKQQPKPPKVEIEKPIERVEQTKVKEIKKEKPKAIRKPKIEIIKEEKEIKNEFQNPLLTKEEKPKKPKEKSVFVNNMITFLEKSFKIIEEKSYKDKEYNCIIEINTDLGPISFLTQAKDKKSISEEDLRKLVSEAQSVPLSAFMIYTGNLAKKAKEFTTKYSSILKTKKVVRNENNNI